MPEKVKRKIGRLEMLKNTDIRKVSAGIKEKFDTLKKKTKNFTEISEHNEELNALYSLISKEHPEALSTIAKPKKRKPKPKKKPKSNKSRDEIMTDVRQKIEDAKKFIKESQPEFNPEKTTITKSISEDGLKAFWKVAPILHKRREFNRVRKLDEVVRKFVSDTSLLITGSPSLLESFVYNMDELLIKFTKDNKKSNK